MSVKLDISTLNKEQQLLITKYLLLQKQNARPWMNKDKPWLNSSGPMLTYYIQKDGYIHLPLSFASALTQQPCNLDSNYPSYNFNFTGSLYDYQVEVCTESLQQLKSFGGSIIGLYPGAGKTIMCSKLSCDLKKLTIVFYHRTTLEVQWYNTYIEFTDAKIWIVGQPLPKDGQFNVILCMDTRFDSIPDNIKSSIGCVIVDEAHCFCTPSRIPVLLGTSPCYFIASTATLEREDGMHSMIKLITGEHGVFRHSTKPFTVYHFQTGICVPYTFNKRGETNFSQLVGDLCNHSLRNSMILTLTQIFKDNKIAILTGRKSHANYLTTYLRQQNESVDSLFGTQKSYTDSRILVGTVPKMGTGFDEKSFCPTFDGKRIDLLIMCVSTKSASVLEQVAGRVFRAHLPTIIDISDMDRISKNHFRERKKWYLERNGDLFDLHITWDTTKIPGTTTQGGGIVDPENIINTISTNSNKNNNPVQANITKHKETNITSNIIDNKTHFDRHKFDQKSVDKFQAQLDAVLAKTK